MENEDDGYESKINWESRQLDSIELQSLLRESPDNDRFRELKDFESSSNPDQHYFGRTVADELSQIEFVKQALKEAFSSLLDARSKGYGSHATGHSIASCFVKCLEIFSCQFVHFDATFTNVIRDYSISLKESFEPIKQTLYAGVTFPRKNEDEYHEDSNMKFSHWEKRTLLRAFFPKFQEEWNRFERMNWKKEYIIFWDICFGRYKIQNLQKKKESEESRNASKE